MIKLCIVDNCLTSTHARGKYCAKHEARIRRTGRLDLKPRLTLEQRLLARVKIINNCWIWQGVKTTKERPYGRLFWKGKQRLTHHLSYQNFKGEIPEGLLVCHTCDNPSCINPDHLWLGTHKDNSDDKIKKGRDYKPIGYLKGENHLNAKLTNSDVIQIKNKLKSGIKKSKLAKEFNVSYVTIMDIQRGRRWSHI